MFKLPNRVPTRHDSAQEWADYAEYLAINDKNISLRQLMKVPALISDEVEVEGVEDETDALLDIADDVVAEIKRRKQYCRDNYPFVVIDADNVIQYTDNGEEFELVYRYLLYSTRMNMTSGKVQNGIDGTQTFERLCAQIALNYFGANTQVRILGTSEPGGGFRDKLRALTADLGEGGEIHDNPEARPQDGSIDVIVWKEFTDRRTSKIIGFGQCKTGTSWLDRLSELNVSAFCKHWFSRHPAVDPIRLFFTAQYFPKDRWFERVSTAGLVFDRTRIMDYLPEMLPVELLDEIRNWVSGVEVTLATK